MYFLFLTFSDDSLVYNSRFGLAASVTLSKTCLLPDYLSKHLCTIEEWPLWYQQYYEIWNASSSNTLSEAVF